MAKHHLWINMGGVVGGTGEIIFFLTFVFLSCIRNILFLLLVLFFFVNRLHFTENLLLCGYFCFLWRETRLFFPVCCCCLFHCKESWIGFSYVVLWIGYSLLVVKEMEHPRSIIIESSFLSPTN
ncbi:hypothetical protein BC829DRAFT_392192 [Chytridium lagenaria]|nr:hypothetical protein BC829DRAFT_392192 [Chytridium lagenaria]